MITPQRADFLNIIYKIIRRIKWKHKCEIPSTEYSICMFIFSPLSYFYQKGSHLFFLKRFYLFTFRERGRVGERKEEKHQYVRDTRTPATAYLARNPGM